MWGQLGEWLNSAWGWPFLQVVIVDLSLAGDNALAISAAAAAIPARRRAFAILLGILAAVVVRVALSSATLALAHVVGFALVAGMLRLWRSWTIWVRARRAHVADAAPRSQPSGARPADSIPMSAAQIVLADMSMSIDNILAVADPIREISIVVVAGLAVAIAIAGVAAVTIARFIRATRFASPVGLVVYVLLALELYTAFELLYRGGHDVLLHPSLKDAIERMSGARSP